MTRESYASLQQKIEKEIQKLKKQAEALKAKQRTPVIKDIVRKMREYDITPDDITKAFSKTKETGKRAPNVSNGKSTGATWTGRGKAPRWISNAESQGHSRDTFLIKPNNQ